MEKIYIGDIGVSIDITFANIHYEDIDKGKLIIRKPNKKKISYALEKDDDKKVLNFTNSDDIFDVKGEWIFQPYVELSDGFKGRGSEFSIYVDEGI